MYDMDLDKQDSGHPDDHLQPDEVSRKEDKRKGSDSKEVGDVESQGGRSLRTDLGSKQA